jgi:hypothetical protein
MKTIITIITVFLLHGSMFSQWESDTRLTNNSSQSLTAYNNAKTIGSDGSNLHTVWTEGRDGNLEIYYKRSVNDGVSWNADVRLTNSSGSSYYPAIHVSGNIVLVTWTDNRDGNYEIYFKKSADNGNTWSSDTRLTSNSSVSDYPSIDASGSTVIIAWQDNRDGNYEIYSKRSGDGGNNWGADQRLSSNSSFSEYPAVTISGAKVNVAWEDNRDGNREIYSKYSADGGVSWSGENRITNNSSQSTSASITSEGDFVDLTWSDQRDGNWEIYYKYSADGGINFGPDQRLTNASGNSWYPSIATDDAFIHICWQDARDGNNEVYYKLSTDGGTTWLNDTRLTNDAGASNTPSINISGSALHIVWSDNRDGNTEIYYKRNPSGNPIGIVPISTTIPADYSLSQNYPNPFNPVTNINFAIPSSGIVKLSVFDMTGREVAVLANGHFSAGTYGVDFDASSLSSGVYFYRIYAEGEGQKFTKTLKLVLIK